MSRYTFQVYGEGHLAETLRCELAHPFLDPASTRVVGGLEVLAFVAHDVTDHADADRLAQVRTLLEQAKALHGLVVVLSQVPPGWTRRAAGGRAGIFYQADTIIVRCAVERMLRPEQFIVGCADPAEPLPLAYQEYLAAHDGCPVRQMDYESAEIAKCAINYMLTKQIEVANELARVCEVFGADYGDVASALRGDARIGREAYLRPGEPNQHLMRDVVTVRALLGEEGGRGA